MKDITEELSARLYLLAANMAATVEFWCVVYIPTFTTVNWPWLQ